MTGRPAARALEFPANAGSSDLAPALCFDEGAALTVRCVQLARKIPTRIALRLRFTARQTEDIYNETLSANACLVSYQLCELQQA